MWLKKDYAMNKLPEQLYREIENPLSIVNAKDEFVILDNPLVENTIFALCYNTIEKHVS